MSKILGISVGRDFESIAKLWLRDKQFKYINMCNAAVLWTLWKTRNDLCFQDPHWRGTRKILGRCAQSIKSWSMLVPKAQSIKSWSMLVSKAGDLDRVVEDLENISASPMRIAWRNA
jgi:hypothetical protein